MSMQPPPPGPEHAVFRKDVGTWDVTLEITAMPGTAPQESSGVATCRLASGGRWLIVDFRNETSGFEGHGVYGFDRARGCYVGSWVDDMRPFMSVSKGTWDEGARTMTWMTDCPGPGGDHVTLRETMQLVDPDTQVFRSFFEIPGVGEHEVITATYRRRG